MYLAKYKNRNGTDIVFWCKPFSIKLHISPKRYWKHRRDRRMKTWKWANGIIGGKIKR